MPEDLDEAALDYHRNPRPGKLEVKATKPLASQRDLALAYSPGVAAACRAIVDDPVRAADYTARGNLVAVISNGTAVLGLGAIGPLAGKPVMEGKAVLFKEFAGVDVFDLELAEQDPERFIDAVAALEPTFGGINLEDIKAPECFAIEEGLRRRMAIPVFHDDQHGTAIVVAAAVLNGLRVVGKDLADARLVTAGAGAAALACLDLLVDLGLRREHVLVTDIAGVVHAGRTEEMDPYKARYAVETPARTLAEALAGADVFLGLSAAGVLRPEWLPAMAERPLILALANPVPEVRPEEARAARPDAVIATGRSDYPNQVNNVLCFPFLFRGALDVGATTINGPMKRACVEAIAALARAEPSDVVGRAYGGARLRFGADYLLPKPFDPRLLAQVAPAVARAAMESGVAARPLDDLEAYRQGMQQRVYRTGAAMKPVFEMARELKRRVVFADGEDERVLHTAQQAAGEGLARPILVGRRRMVTARVADLGLDLVEGRDYRLVDPEDNPERGAHLEALYRRVQRRGYSLPQAETAIDTEPAVLAAVLLESGAADAMLCGLGGRFADHLRVIEDVVGRAPDAQGLTSYNVLVLPSATLFVTDAYVQEEPGAAEVARIAVQVAEEVRRFGITPRVALLSHSNFGSHAGPSARKMSEALARIRDMAPELAVEGEMHADVALDPAARGLRFPHAALDGAANLLVMPNQDAANIAFNLLKVVGEGLSIGPVLVGASRSAHVLTPSVTVRGLLNMTALAAVRGG